MTACERRRRGQRGFSYLWMLLVVALLGVGLVRAVEIDATLVRRDKEMQLRAIGREFRAALVHYHAASAAGGPQYPSALDQLLRDDRSPGLVRHLRRVYADPMTGKPDWVPVTLDGRIVGIHSASDGHPVKQAGFDSDEFGFEGREHYSDWVFGQAADLPASGVAPGAASQPASGLPAAASDAVAASAPAHP